MKTENAGADLTREVPRLEFTAGGTTVVSERLYERAHFEEEPRRFSCPSSMELSVRNETNLFVQVYSLLDVSPAKWANEPNRHAPRREAPAV